MNKVIKDNLPSHTAMGRWKRSPFRKATERKVSPLGGEIVGYITFTGEYKPVRKARRKLFAVMPDGSRRLIFKSRHSGWNLPDGRCFTSSLDSAKREWREAGATIVSELVKD